MFAPFVGMERESISGFPAKLARWSDTETASARGRLVRDPVATPSIIISQEQMPLVGLISKLWFG